MRIYEYVFTYDSVACKSGRWEIRDPSTRRRAVSYHLGPTTVCKQMRKETMHLPFSLNTLALGKEPRDVDPYYEWWIDHRIKDPCLWAIKAINRMPRQFMSEKTTFKLNLWIYPSMLVAGKMSGSEWTELEGVFGRLLSLMPGQLTVAINFLFYYERLRCDYEQECLTIHGQTTLEIRKDDLSQWKERICEVIDDRRSALQRHEDHYDINKCRVYSHRDKLASGLNDVEGLAGRVVDVMQSRYHAVDYKSGKE